MRFLRSLATCPYLPIVPLPLFMPLSPILWPILGGFRCGWMSGSGLVVDGRLRGQLGRLELAGWLWNGFAVVAVAVLDHRPSDPQFRQRSFRAFSPGADIGQFDEMGYPTAIFVNQQPHLETVKVVHRFSFR